QPGDHQRRLFDDPAGDPTRALPAPAHYADIGRRLRPDLYRLRQLDADDPDARADGWLSLLRQSRRGVRHRGRDDHAADVIVDVPGDARNLALELAGQPRRRRL